MADVSINLRSVGRILSILYKHDLDEFSLIITSIKPSDKGYEVSGKLRIYSEGHFSFKMLLGKDRKLVSVK